VHVVRMDATSGRLLSASVPAGQSVRDKQRAAELLSAARVLPEEAVEEVAARAADDPHFGKVTEVELNKGLEERTVWSVTVAAIRSGSTHTYQVDAVTSKVVASRSDGPSSGPHSSAPS